MQIISTEFSQSLTDIGVENESGDPSSNFGLVCCIRFHMNALTRAMNPSLLSQAMG